MDYIIEIGAQIVTALLVTLIGVMGAWLTAQIAKRQELASINAAQQEVITAAQITVGELQQTVVDGLKAARKDGKLTKSEIENLGQQLITMTMDKLSKPAYNLLKAAAVDVNALIKGAGEDWILSLKKEKEQE